ncbi:MAG: 1-acyl-sn-glycerol-3-phosphate acyltransferase [Bacteroidota bacterium]|nr:1-acyl-sn-glycerol-3-phosphate acyltransferase [Bacteroidota bacterium]MDP4211405.1 1-acyl-sn-glycerol-3-phosphate acyltransferase [Bacteroidota bacterium]MDP4248632.1 1-acyl-sn-glycerol-3-phosphate acyltransferase [Bacteroidota bacterium]
MKIFCRTIHVNRPDLLKTKGPLILASNHPNAFLDAIILGSLFYQPVHFLARGDAFRKPLIRKFLNALQLIPIHRLTEGKENLGLNEVSFTKCHQILSSGGIVLIFAEGLSLNQWILSPMKKGTARIALAAMNDSVIGSRIRILPVSLNYNSFESLSKTLLIHFDDMISINDFSGDHSETKKMHQFNGLLADRLSAGMLQSAAHTQIIQLLISNHGQHDVPYLKTVQDSLNSAANPAVFEKLQMPGSMASDPASFLFHLLLTLILFVPAAVGWILHVPLYFPLKRVIHRKTTGTGFFDSIMFCALMITYPVYWLLLNIIIQPLLKNEWIRLSVLFMPLLGWISLYWKESFLQMRNYLALTGKERKMLNRMYPVNGGRASLDMIPGN